MIAAPWSGAKWENEKAVDIESTALQSTFLLPRLLLFYSSIYSRFTPA